MANYTNATALSAAVAALKGNTPEDVDALIAKLSRMAEVAAKPKKSTKGTPTKEQMANDALIREVVATMKAHGVNDVTSAWLRENVRGITSAQKVSGLMGRAIRNGIMEKHAEKDGMHYTLA